MWRPRRQVARWPRLEGRFADLAEADDSATAVGRWAREQGCDVGIRGRIPKEIKDAYREAQT